MDDSVNVNVRQVMRRGCGYPKPGGVYPESIGEAGGTLPIIVVIDPPIEYSHFHRGFVYISLDDLLASREVKYVGSSVVSAEEWNLRQKYQGVAHDVFGEGTRIKDGQVLRFRDVSARILAEAGWQPGAMASAMLAARVLREHAAELAALVEIAGTRK